MCSERDGKFVVPKLTVKVGKWIGQTLSVCGDICVIRVIWTPISGYRGPDTFNLKRDNFEEFDTVQEAKRHIKKTARNKTVETLMSRANDWNRAVALPKKPVGNFVCTKCGKTCDGSTVHRHLTWGIPMECLVVQDGHYLCCANAMCDAPVRRA